MNIDDIIQGIINSAAKSIYSEFGKNFKIYTEEIKQGFHLPCFFMKLFSASQKQGLGERTKLINKFCIFYFPEKAHKNRNMNDIYIKLYSILKFIPYKNYILPASEFKIEKVSGILLNGLSTNYENSDSTLCMYINYDFYVKEISNIPYMERLIINK